MDAADSNPGQSAGRTTIGSNSLTLNAAPPLLLPGADLEEGKFQLESNKHVDAANRIVWSEERKDWLRTWQPKLRRDVNRLTEQVSRFKQALPQFAQQAEDVARPALESGWQLLRLSWKNKLNPLSPEEADTQLSLVKEKFTAWADFTRRSDISQPERCD